jgi:hypothetical protein
MNPRIEMPNRIIRDVLTKGEVFWIQQEYNKENPKMHLIATVSNDENKSFAGYRHMNNSLPDGLTVNRLEDGKLDTMPVVVGG